MTSPSNDDATSSKYNVQIGEGKGIVIGDRAQVVQQFYSTPSEPQVDLATAETIYRQKVIDKYKWLSFSWFEHGAPPLADIPLEHIFVRLTLTVEKVVREVIPPEESSKQKRGEERPRERVITKQEPIELDQALTQHLLIIGEPGAGKSTLLRWLAVTFAQKRQREPDRLGSSADIDRLPVLIELGHLPERYLRTDGGETPNWIEFLPDYITKGEMAFTAVPPQLLKQALTTGRCLLLFDGLDEVASRQARIRLTESLAELTRLFPGNRVVIGTRPAGVSESMLPSLFRQSHIARFTSADIQRFFRFWYALAGNERLTNDQRQAEADALYARVQAAPATLQLAATPLLSTILVLIWHQEGVLPERRVELYERCCRVLIEQWEWVKKAHAVVYPKELDDKDWEDHVRLLMPIAYAIHSQEQRTSARKDELVDLLTRTLSTLGYEQAANRIAKQFLASLGLRSGLLQYMGDDEYGFPHLTFQEYLAARYIAAQPDPVYIDLVMTHLHEAWWQEVHLLTIGVLGSGSEQKAQEAEANTKKASALLLTILHSYKPPSDQRRVIQLLAREFELAARGYAECASDVTMPVVDAVLSTQAVSLLRDIAHNKDRYKKQENLLTAVGLLQRRGNKAVTNALLKDALRGPNRRTFEETVSILEKLGAGSDKEVEGVLLAALHDPRQFKRKDALRILAKLGAGDNEEVVRALVMALHDPDMRGLSVYGLAKLGASGNKEAVRALVMALHDPDQQMWWLAANSLAKLGASGNEEAVRALVMALHDPDQHVRVEAARGLAKLGAGDNEEVVETLLAALHNPDLNVRYWATEGLGALGANSNKEVVETLLAALHNPDPRVRCWAAEGLGALGANGNKEVVEALLAALHDPEQIVREEAAKGLEALGAGGNKEVVEALLAALHNPEQIVREEAASSLGKPETGGNKEVVEALLAALHDPDPRVRVEAARGLAKLGAGGNEEVVEALLAALHDPGLRWRAVEGLGALGAGGNEEVVGALLTALHDWERVWLAKFDVVTQKEAVHSLGRLEIKSGIQRNQALTYFNSLLHGIRSSSTFGSEVGDEALTTARKLLEGHPPPGYRWVSLQKRQARLRSLKRLAILAGVVAAFLLVALTVTLLNPTSLIARWVTWLGVLAGIVSLIGMTLRDLSKRKQSN